MGKIKKILENELLGGTTSNDVYPVTSTQAVYTSENTKLSDSYVKDVSCESNEKDASIILKSESDTTINTITIPAATTEKAGVMSAADKEKLDTIVINDLTTGGADKALSAEMGKTIANTVNKIKPVVINGNVTNAADEEDITSEDNLLKLKDRTGLNGMGYIILRKGKSFKEQLIQSNTIYEIRYDFDLGGETVEIPENCTLKFEGGRLKNGSITLQNTLLLGDVQVLCQLSESSTIKNSSVVIDWFGAKSNDATFDNADVFTNIGNIANLGEIIIPTGTYYSTSFLLPDQAILRGTSKTRSIIKAIGNGKDYEYTTNNVDYSVKSCLIAIRSPRSTITNLCIDGGANEGYENIAIGMFQAGFITTVSNVVIKNASIGAIDINANGGIFNITQCEFYHGCSEFAIRTKNMADKLTIEKCDFEVIISPEASLINIAGKNNKSVILHNNRFENCEVKYVYYIQHAGTTSIISDNLYLLPTFNESSSIYNIQTTSSGITIAREMYQNVGKVLHLGIVKPNAHRVILSEYTYGLTINTWGYYDEDNNYVGYYGTTGKPLFYVNNNREGVTVFPNCSVDNFTNYHFKLPSQVVMANLLFKTDGLERVINVPSPVQRLVFETSKMSLRKEGKNYDLSYLFQDIKGVSNNRPQSPITGSSYFDTTLNKPIWWNGTIWVDSTGTEV